jgi:uncharacterized protein YuzE
MTNAQTQDVEYDPEHGLMYIWLDRQKPWHHMRSLDGCRNVDYSQDDTPIGVELVCVKKGVDLTGLPSPAELRAVLERYGISILQIQ